MTTMKTLEPKSNIEWRAWGREDPLFGVASSPGKDRHGPSPWTDESFYSLGKSDWKDFHLHWQRYGLETDSCVEIGCGAGRITRQMARVFSQVHALDVSPDMLDYARRNVTARNVHFYLTSGAEIPLPDVSVSAAFSCHVFQHFDSCEVGLKYFREIHRVLRPEGTLMIHLPMYAWPEKANLLEPMLHWWRRLGDLRARANRNLIRHGMFRPVMRSLSYPMQWFYSELPKLGFGDIELSVFPLSSSHDPHPCVMARNSGPGSSASPTEATPATEPETE